MGQTGMGSRTVIISDSDGIRNTSQYLVVVPAAMRTLPNQRFLTILIVQTSVIGALNERGFLGFLFSPCKCRCGIPNREARLIGGVYMAGHEFPWAGLIQIRDGRFAPATLINDRFLITAATNVLGLTPLDIKITIGQFDICFPDVSSSNTSVEKIIMHPDFSPANRAHDIALLKLNTPIKIEKKVSPICLATPNTDYLGQVATVFAWSKNVTQEGTLSILRSCRPRKLGLPVLRNTDCLNSVAEVKDDLVNDKGCIGVVGLPSPICRVDAGGPVMFRSRQGTYEILGVLTDRNECLLEPGLVIYTRINDHLSWIIQNTKGSCYCFKT